MPTGDGLSFDEFGGGVDVDLEDTACALRCGSPDRKMIAIRVTNKTAAVTPRPIFKPSMAL